MPCICLETVRIEDLCVMHSVMIHQFLRRYGCHRSDQSDHLGFCAVVAGYDLHHSFVSDEESRDKEDRSKYGRGDALVAFMTVRLIVILMLESYPCPYVCDERRTDVRQRMYRLR